MRKLSWIIAGILCTTPVFVQAAELGNAKISSHLTERLIVKIPITGLNGVGLDQVKVRLAPEKYYQQAGLSLDGLSGNVTFKLTSEGKRNYVIVRSKRPVSNPILSLLIQINAGNSSQIKEFDLLLDPPVHAERRAAAASQRSLTGSAPVPAAKPRPVQPSSTWMPVANVPDVKMGGTYQVKRGDTLYDIAKTAAVDKSVPVRPMMQAIINANPKAFIDGNGNLLKAGSTLKVPERATTAAADKSTASQTTQTAATESKTGTEAKPNTQNKPDEQANSDSEAKPKLQLLAVEPDKNKADDGTSSPSTSPIQSAAGEDISGVLPAIDAPSESSVSTAQQNNEAIASIDAKSEVMSKQISMLNDQLKQVQGLVSERNQSIEQLQNKIKESNEQTQLLKKQLEAQNNNFWLQWAPYLLGAAGLLIIILLLLAISRGRKRDVPEAAIYSTTGVAASSASMQPKAEVEPQVVTAVEPMALDVPSAQTVVDSKAIIDEARLLFSYNLHSQAYDLIEEAIAQRPDELSLYQELAQMHSEANNPTESEKVLARIDEKFGSEHRPNVGTQEAYAQGATPAMSGMESEESLSDSSAPTELDKVDAIPDSAFSIDTGLDMPNEESKDTSLDFEENVHAPKEAKAESDLDSLSLEGSEAPAATPDAMDLELADSASEVTKTPVDVSLAPVAVDDSVIQDDTRLGLAEAFLGVGDQESYQMIAEEIESEGNPALLAALKQIEQKFS